MTKLLLYCLTFPFFSTLDNLPDKLTVFKSFVLLFALRINGAKRLRLISSSEWDLRAISVQISINIGIFNYQAINKFQMEGAKAKSRNFYV